MRRLYPSTLTLALLSAAMFIGGCSKSASPQAVEQKVQQYLDRAESYRHQGQYGAAAIEARNAIQLSPQAPAGALELAALMNDLGQGKQASQLLQPFADQGGRDVVLAAADAYLIQRKFHSALDYLRAQSKRLNLQNDNAVRLRIARAQLGLGQYDDAQAELYALRDVPAFAVQAQLHLAQLDLLRGSKAAGAEAVQELLKKEPNNVDVLILAAHLAERDGNLEKAEDLLSRALMNLPETDILMPQKVAVLQQLTTVLTKEGRTGEALVYAKTLADANPEGARLEEEFKQGVADFQAGKLDEAAKALTEVYQKSHNDMAGTLLGMIKYAQNDLSGAADYLDRSVDPEVASDSALMALASTQLRLDQPARLLALIGPEQRRDIKNPQLRALVGIALIQTGSPQEGEQMVHAALAEQPGNNAIRAALAQEYVREKQPEKALTVIQEGLAKSPRDAGLNRLLIQTYLALGKQREALAAAQQLAAGEPPRAEHYLIYGRVAMLARQFDSSRDALQHALQLQPKLIDARLLLAQLALLQKQPQQAEEQYRQLLADHPDSVAAARGFITAEEMLKGRSAVVADVEALVSGVAKSTNAQAVVAEYYIRNQRLDDAHRVLQALPAPSADSYAGQVEQYYALAAAGQALTAKDYPAARLAVVDALRRTPSSPALLAMLAHIEIRAGELGEADKVITRLSEARPQDPNLPKLRTELAAAGQHGAGATQDLRKLWELTPSDTTAAQLYKNLLSNNKEAAPAFLEEWQNKLPGSDRPLLIRAMDLQQQGKDKEALPLYEAALQRNGNSTAALNNLAWLYFERGDKRALPLAEKAARLAPDNPAVLDTYGWLLGASQQRQKGLEILRQAAKLAPDSKDIAEHLAQLEKQK